MILDDGLDGDFSLRLIRGNKQNFSLDPLIFLEKLVESPHEIYVPPRSNDISIHVPGISKGINIPLPGITEGYNIPLPYSQESWQSYALSASFYFTDFDLKLGSVDIIKLNSVGSFLEDIEFFLKKSIGESDPEKFNRTCLVPYENRSYDFEIAKVLALDWYDFYLREKNSLFPFE